MKVLGTKFYDLTGVRFHAWTVLRFEKVMGRRQALWICKCDCGNERPVCASKLRRNQSKSCGECKTVKKVDWSVTPMPLLENALKRVFNRFLRHSLA